MTTEDDVLRRIAAFDTAEEAVRSEEFLFHGTGEAIDTPLKPGGYDGVLWTAQWPSIAQSYIPAAGSTFLVAKAMPYEENQRVAPNRFSEVYNCLVKHWFGFTDAHTQPERDPGGIARSYRIPPGYPTYGDIEQKARELGYDDGRGYFEIKVSIGPGGETVPLPADYRKQGRLFVTLREGLRFADIRQASEGDLTAVEYHNHTGFRAAEDSGYDGVIINDFAQTDTYGNFGHLSYGLFSQAAKSTRFVGTDSLRAEPVKGAPTTEAFAELFEKAKADYAPVLNVSGF